jgi:hypothetical protein
VLRRNPNLDEQRQKSAEAQTRLVRHERLTRIALALVLVLNIVLLALVVSLLWNHPWTQESIRGVIP